MIDDSLKEQATLYAAGALPAAEAREFESAMAQSVELQLLVTDLHATLDGMAAALPRRTPPPALKARIMREIDSRAGVVVGLPTGSGFGFWQFLPWAAAAALAFLCVWFAAQQRASNIALLRAQQELAAIESQSQAADRQHEAQRNESKAERDQLHQRILTQIADQQRQSATERTRLVERIKELEKRIAQANPSPRPATPPNNQTPSPDLPTTVPGGDVPPGGLFGGANASTTLGVLRSTNPGSPAIGAVAWNPATQSGTILIDGLNVPAQDRDYQLWVFVDGSPVSAGLLRVDTTGHVQGSYTIAQSINTVQRFAITDERKGGVPQPAGEIIMLSN